MDKDGWQLLLWQLCWGLVNAQLNLVWFIFRSQLLFQVIPFHAHKLVGSVTTTAFLHNDSSSAVTNHGNLTCKEWLKPSPFAFPQLKLQECVSAQIKASIALGIAQTQKSHIPGRNSRESGGTSILEMGDWGRGGFTGRFSMEPGISSASLHQWR